MSPETSRGTQVPAGGGRLFAGGEWVPAADGRRVAGGEPTGEEQLAEVSKAGVEDVDRAVAAARGAAAGWAEVPWGERARPLFELADRIEGHAEELARIETLNAGMPIRGARRDVANAVAHLRYCAGLAGELKGHSLQPVAGSVDLVLREPYGVVGRIVAFNHPFQFAVAAIGPPLVAGNAVVLKPAEPTPLSALRLAELAADLLPAGLVSVLPGAAECGSALVRHPDVPRLGFTGSVATGQRVLRDAADGVKAVSLELGGKNPMVVLPDVEPARAAELAIVGMNLQRTAGQSCGSTSRLYLHEDVHDAVLEEVARRFDSLVVGDPMLEETDVGPLAHPGHRDRVLGYIHAGSEDGARLVTGGPERPPGCERGCYVRPTVFADVDDAMRIAREEIFGPVLSVLRWRDEEDVVARANASTMGLTANVVTNDLSAALRFARRLEAGYVWVNGRGQRPLGAPFGGFGHSGLGEENSLGELLSYTRVKNVFLGALAEG